MKIDKIDDKIAKQQIKINQLKAQKQALTNRKDAKDAKQKKINGARSDRRKYILADLIVNNPILFSVNLMSVYDSYLFSLSKFKIEQFTNNFICCKDNKDISLTYSLLDSNIAKLNLYIIGYILESDLFKNPDNYNSVIKFLDDTLQEHWDRRLFSLPSKNFLINDSGESSSYFDCYFENIDMPIIRSNGDKEQEYWSYIYAVLFFDNENNCFGTVGQTKKELHSLIDFFRKKIINNKLSSNRIDTAIRQAYLMGTDCFYIIPLEYVYGSIDTKGWIKDYWRKALHTAGINFDIGDNSLYLINGESTRFFHYGKKQIQFFPKVSLM